MTTLPRVAARRCIRWAQLDILTLYSTTYFADKQNPYRLSRGGRFTSTCSLYWQLLLLLLVGLRREQLLIWNIVSSGVFATAILVVVVHSHTHTLCVTPYNPRAAASRGRGVCWNLPPKPQTIKKTKNNPQKIRLGDSSFQF